MRNAESIEASSALKQDASEQPSEQPKRGKADHLREFCWKKGQSGNPGGRPKRDYAAELSRAIIEENPQELYNALLGQAKKSAYAFQVLSERAYGKLKEVREVTGKDGGPIEFAEMTETDIQARIGQLEEQLAALGYKKSKG